MEEYFKWEDGKLLHVWRKHRWNYWHIHWDLSETDPECPLRKKSRS